MDKKINFIESFTHHVCRKGEEVALRFLAHGDPKKEVQEWNYIQLDQRARGIATYLNENGFTGKTVLLAYPPGLEFVAGLLGCFYAGAIAVPAHSPTSGRQRTDRFLVIAEDCKAELALTDDKTLSKITEIQASKVEEPWPGIHWVSTEGLSPSSEKINLASSHIAFLQYTSGSTQNPRGVKVSYENLTANLWYILDNLGYGHCNHHMISWLPQYHDMGLVGAMLAPLYFGFPVSFFPPVQFIKKPIRWLNLISHYQATLTTAPTFGYDLAVRGLKPNDLESTSLNHIDLSSLETAICGAEPVRADVLERFIERFSPCGLQQNVFHSSYGLAENTLLVSSAQGTPAALTHSFSAAALKEGWALPQDVPKETQPLHNRSIESISRQVSCGAHSPDLCIVDPDTRLPCPANKVGEIWLTGSSVTEGYLGHEKGTNQVFGARLANADQNSWLRTGDLGFIHQGQVYVTGRRKNLIIIHGRNYYPQDLERLAETVPGVSPHGTAAFGVSSQEEGERAVLVAEFDHSSGKEAQTIIDAVYGMIAEQMELELKCVLLVRRNEIPRTTSGKIQHNACRTAFLEGKLREIARRDGQTSSSLDNPEGYDFSVFDPLEKRSLKYRFDEEIDIEWDRLNEPGIFFTDEYLKKHSLNPESLNQNPRAREIFDWCAALSICINFDVFEMGLIQFVEYQAAGKLGNTKSAKYMSEEEEKHIRVFRRFARHLEGQHPELASRARQLCDEAANCIYSFGSERHDDMFLHLLFTEACTVYLHTVLNKEKEKIQPTWFSVHLAHAKEEAQHLLTNAAYLEAHPSSQETQKQLARHLIEALNHNLLDLCGLHAAMKLVQELFPEIQFFHETIPSPYSAPFFDDLINERCFRMFRKTVPDLEQILHEVKLEKPSQKEKKTGKKAGPIFLLSAPRSGSTLLRGMLSTHSELFCPPELSLLPFTDLQHRESMIKEGQGDGLIQALAELDKLDPESAMSLVKTWLAENHSIPQVFEDLLSRIKRQNLTLVEKSPYNAHRLQSLQKAEELFGKKASYIHLIRHPYPSISSFIRLKLDQLYQELGQVESNTPAAIADLIWSTYNQNILDFFTEIEDHRHYCIHYEDLIRDPKTELQKLCSFLELDFQEEMLQPYEHGRMLEPLRPESLTGDPNFLNKKKLEQNRDEIWGTNQSFHKPSADLQRVSASVGYELSQSSSSHHHSSKNDHSSKNKSSSQKFSSQELEIQRIIQKVVADRLEVNRQEIPLDQSIASLGMASLALMRVESQLEDELGHSIEPMLTHNFPTIESMAHHLATTYALKGIKKGTAREFDKRDPNPQMNSEVEYFYEHNVKKHLNHIELTKPVSNPNSIFLTGVTGFLGAHLLSDFMSQTQAQLFCLVRSESEELALERIRKNLEQYHLWKEEYVERIIPILGDLASKNLGVNEEQYHQLTSTIDLICHNAAQVDFLSNYEQLKKVNVEGTCEILKLATLGRTKPIHYVSTLAVFGSYLNRPVQRVVETQRSTGSEGLSLGYMQSKWVAEELLWKAHDYHRLPVMVYRPAVIGGHTQTGASSSSDFFYRFIQTCLNLETYPDLTDFLIDVSPVDYVSRAVVSLALRNDVPSQAFHLNHPEPISFKVLMESLRGVGYSLEKLPEAEWRTQLKKNKGKSQLGGLEILLEPLWEGDLNLFSIRKRRPIADASYTARQLKEINLICPPLADSNLLKNCFGSKSIVSAQNQGVEVR